MSALLNAIGESGKYLYISVNETSVVNGMMLTEVGNIPESNENINVFRNLLKKLTELG